MDDWSPLARLYHADDTLNAVAAELDALDGRKEPERCSILMSRLRASQDRVLQIIGTLLPLPATSSISCPVEEEILVLIWPEEAERAPRDFRAKFPDDILQDSLPGQLWFGAEVRRGGREGRSEGRRGLVSAWRRARTSWSGRRSRRPSAPSPAPSRATSTSFARYCESRASGIPTFTLTRHVHRHGHPNLGHLDCHILGSQEPSRLRLPLRRVRAQVSFLSLVNCEMKEGRSSYVSAMVPVKSIKEYEAQQVLPLSA